MELEFGKEFYDSETALRGVKNKPDFWDIEKNRPTSAVFKDSKGLSVNRTGENKKYYIISLETLKTNLGENIRAVAEVNCGDCKDLEVYLKYCPLRDNIYHSEIHRSENQILLSKQQAKKLAELCKIV